MSFRATCAVCSTTFWGAHHMLTGRKNLTCSEKCHKELRRRNQKARRLTARLERIKRKHLREAKRKKPVRGKVKKFIAYQHKLPLKVPRRKKLKVAA